MAARQLVRLSLNFDHFDGALETNFRAAIAQLLTSRRFSQTGINAVPEFEHIAFGQGISQRQITSQSGRDIGEVDLLDQSRQRIGDPFKLNQQRLRILSRGFPFLDLGL